MYGKKISKYSRRDLFRGFLRQVRGQDTEHEASGFDPDVLRADRLLRENNYQEAANLYAFCLKKEPDHSEAWQRLGYCRLKLNQTSGARQAWEELSRIRPGDHFAALYTGLSYAMDGNIQKAVDAWKSYFNIKQPLIQREINLILALHERGDRLEPAEVTKSVKEAIDAQIQSQR